jgi:hypothetical protein
MRLKYQMALITPLAFGYCNKKAVRIRKLYYLLKICSSARPMYGLHDANQLAAAPSPGLFEAAHKKRTSATFGQGFSFFS